jgi:DNA-binding HxlR family transcriptional regulator
MRSALAAALDRVGDRWSLLLVEALLSGPRRWSDLSEEVAGIAPNVLSDRIRRLEHEGIVSSEPYSDRPLRLAYGLTAAGRELAGAVRLLTDWGARREDGAVAPRHPACGTPMEVRWHCPTCDLTVEGDISDERTDIVTV